MANRTRQQVKHLPHFRFGENPGDPYRADTDDGSYCTTCGITMVHGAWKLNADDDAKKHPITCPACRKINDNYFLGELTLSGTFLHEHQEEIMNLVTNEEKKLRSKTPLSRIGKIEADGELIVIRTTNEKMAWRIGKALASAYSGDLEIKWSGDNVFTRVYWHRD